MDYLSANPIPIRRICKNLCKNIALTLCIGVLHGLGIDRSISFSWDVSPEPIVQGYKLYFTNVTTQESRVYSLNSRFLNVCRVDNIPYNSVVEAFITANDGAMEESDPSLTIHYFLGNDLNEDYPLDPPPPENFHFIFDGAINKLVFSWDEQPLSNGTYLLKWSRHIGDNGGSPLYGEEIVTGTTYTHWTNNTGENWKYVFTVCTIMDDKYISRESRDIGVTYNGGAPTIRYGQPLPTVNLRIVK